MQSVRMAKELSRDTTTPGAASVRPQDFFPDWSAQKYRVAVPCLNVQGFEWRRCGKVASLDEILLALGHVEAVDTGGYLAASIYYLYRSRRIVCVKRQKSQSHASAQSMLKARLKPAVIRADMRQNRKEDLVAELCRVAQIEVPGAASAKFNELFDAAVR